GSFLGITVKFGGAFAGYFAVLVLLIYKGPKPPAPQSALPQWQVWEVEGRVIYDDPKNRLPPEHTIQVSVDPPDLPVRRDGSFRGGILVVPGPFGDTDFPTLSIISSDKDYGSQTIHLDQDQKEFRITRDNKHHKIHISEGIVLGKLPPYSPTDIPFQP